jgi:hypothetical protein
VTRVNWACSSPAPTAAPRGARITGLLKNNLVRATVMVYVADECAEPDQRLQPVQRPDANLVSGRTR